MRIRYENLKKLGPCFIAFCLSADGYAFEVGPTFFMENQEIWVDIIGYEGKYMFSSFGKVLSIKKNGKRLILKNINMSSGYVGVQLSKNGKSKWATIHRMMGIYFIPNPDNKPEINHKNGLRWDFRKENLEWSTRKENAQHAQDTGLQKSQKGRLSDMGSPIIQMNFNGEFIKEWPSIKRAADSFGKSTASIWCALKGTRKNNAHGFSWKYK